MNKNKVMWVSIISASALIVIALCVILFKPAEKEKTIEEILENDVISSYINVENVEVPNELKDYEEVDLRKVTFNSDTLKMVMADEGIKKFFEKQDKYVSEVIDELIDKADDKILANTIIECEVEDDILYLNVKYRITYTNDKIKELVNTINILIGTEENAEDTKTLSNEELVEKLANGNAYELSNQIFDTIKGTWDYTNLRDLEYGIFCSDLHFQILREVYVRRIWDNFNNLLICKHNGKLYFEYHVRDAFNLLNVEEKKISEYGSFERLYFKDKSKYKIPEVKTYDYENDKFKIDDSYLSKIYNMNDQFLVAKEHKVLDFLDNEEVDLYKYGLEDECACINEEFIDSIRLTRVTFKGLSKKTFKEFVYNQEKTFREIFIALAENSSGAKHSVDGLAIKTEDGPYDTKITANVYKDVLSLHTKNIIPYAIGDTEVINHLLVNVRNGNKLNNTEMFAMLEYNKDDVIDQVATVICTSRPDFDKESVKNSVANHFEDMIFYIKGEKVYFSYSWDKVFNWLDVEVNKGGPFNYEEIEIIKK